MKFVAKHISFQQIDGVFNFALGDRSGLPGEEPPDIWVIIQFGEEGDQERALGLTGLHIETSGGEPNGYEKVEHIDYDGRLVSIIGTDGTRVMDASIETDMMAPDAIRDAVSQCNRANATWP